MELVSKEAFHKWAESRELIIEPEYCGIVKFAHDQGDSRWWSLPFDTRERLAMLTISLDQMESWESCWVYKRGGGWSFSRTDRPDLNECGVDTIIRWTGIPNSHIGALVFSPQDRAKLALTLLAFDEYGWNVNYDLFVVPDHGKQILWVDHEDAIIVQFADKEQIASYVERMTASGFPEWHDSSTSVI
jgi:hypothetical protein